MSGVSQKSEGPNGSETKKAGAVTALLTAEEVADLLRVTTSWVYAQSRAERIPHVRLGRYVRFRRDAIERWIARVEAGADPTALPFKR